MRLISAKVSKRALSHSNMLCRTLLFRAAQRPELRLDRLTAMLQDQRVANAPWMTHPVHTLPATQQALFAPLFATNTFVFENHQLTMLGDTLVDKYLSEVFLDYFLEMGIVVTTNAAKLVNAVFHNHFSMRRLAEDIGLMNLSTPPEPVVSARGAVDLSFLEAAEAGPSPSDVAGTSFDFAPLPCGQSTLGWKFSHFIGALQRCYGDDAVTALLESLFGLKSSSNLVGKSTDWLYELVKRFSPMHVTEALLMAQGISAEFVGSSDYIGPDEIPHKASDAEGKPAASEFSVDAEEESDGVTTAVVNGSQAAEPQAPATSVRGFDVTSNSREGALAGSLPRDSSQSLKSHLAGPEFINALDIWRDQVLQRGDVRSPNALEAIASSGWLSPEEHANEKRGAAYRGFVDFSTTVLFADIAGVAHPVSGKRVARNGFAKAVRDKPFFDKLSDFRDGLPMDTGGQSVPDFLKSINKSHRRVFDVALVVDGTKVLGRATSPSYSEGRVAVSQAYLMRTLKDLHFLSGTARSGEQSSRVS
jgi:hypothetical protein